MLPLVAPGRSATAQETSEQRLVISLERVWDRAAHRAYTDLVDFQGALYCTFREGTEHIPGLNGTIRVLRSRDRMHWESVALLDEQHVDLRDPKLSITPDGRLMLTMGASYYRGRERQRIESRVAFSDREGNNFSAPQPIELPPSVQSGFDWLWRVTWHDQRAWGCVQQVPSRTERALHLVSSADGIRYEQVAQLDVDLPTETTLRFLPDGTMLAMIRRTATAKPLGWIGRARPPYTDWTFEPADRQFGGPNFIALPRGLWLAGSRDYRAKPYTTQLWLFDVQSNRFNDLLTLPSDGDNSYPGLVVDAARNQVLISYYSAHEGKPAIYLATLRLDTLTSTD